MKNLFFVLTLPFVSLLNVSRTKATCLLAVEFVLHSFIPYLIVHRTPAFIHSFLLAITSHCCKGQRPETSHMFPLIGSYWNFSSAVLAPVYFGKTMRKIWILANF